MVEWIFGILLAIIGWGIYDILLKSAIDVKNDYFGLMLFSSLAAVLLSAALWLKDRDTNFSQKFLLYSCASGLCLVLGSIGFAIASGKQKLSIVVPLAATYPVVALLYGLIFLRENLSTQQLIGALLLIAGSVLVTR